MTPACRRRFFEILRCDNPAPTTELQFGNVYQLLVAVVLSAQATDKGVNAATEKLFAEVKDARAMLAMGEDGLTAFIRSIGLYRTKARNVMALSRILADSYDGRVPRGREELEALPGVGRKTANVVLNTAFGMPTIAVDTHIFRVANRTGLAPGKNVRVVEDELVRVVPEEFKPKAHHWLILLGRYTCKARAPLCGQCAVRACCAYFAERA